MTTPASSSNATASNSSATSNSIHANVIPSEVGWQFVPQYYTFVNKQPHRLHCFYTKNSTFIHGTEGEDGRPCYGQQEIHNKILSIGFQDCKVFIHSVDAQSSANGGIIIQVIGEMSNRGEPWRKFAQTFFLAEQPNGYFVLNDIFRFLKEESVEADDEEPGDTTHPIAASQSDVVHSTGPDTQPTQDNTEAPAAVAVQTVHVPIPAAQYDSALPEHLQPSRGSTISPAPQPATSEPEPEPVPAVVQEEKTPQPNGIHHPVVAEPEPAPAPAPPPALTEPIKQPAAEPAPPPAPPVETSSSPAAAPLPAPVAAPASPAVASAPAATAKPAPTPSPKPVAAPPQPAPPSQPKTWANLAAANSNKWGPQVAQEARGVSAAPPPAPAPAPKPEPPRAAVNEKDGARELHPAHQAALSVSTPQCFVKSVTEVVSHSALSATLTTRFGPIKELEIVRNKACAFLEFSTLDAARRAIVASLPVSAGGDGGVRIELEGGGSARISVETRKERGERPPPRPRSGVTPGQDRGGFRGGARGRGAGVGAGAGAGRGATSKP